MENIEEPNQQTIEDSWQDDPKNFRLGLFYFNKDDKRVFPRKRVFGWNINFANPWSIVINIIIGAFFLAVMYLILERI